MLLERIKKEISEFEKHMKAQGIDYVYDQAYYIAFVNELEWYFTDYLEPEEVENRYSALTKVDGNICECIMDYYTQLNHPERYNIFMFHEDLDELITTFIKCIIGIGEEQ